MTRVDHIVHKLNQVSQQLYSRGYGVPQLIFSDLSSVSTTDWPLYEEIETLLKAGKQPLGVIAPLRDSRGEPLVVPLQDDNEIARAELSSLAHLWYRHRM